MLKPFQTYRDRTRMLLEEDLQKKEPQVELADLQLVAEQLQIITEIGDDNCKI